jgi:tRNA-dihydrouridine synthase 3
MLACIFRSESCLTPPRQDYPLSVAYLDSIGESMGGPRDRKAATRKSGQGRKDPAVLGQPAQVEVEDDGTQPNIATEADVGNGDNGLTGASSFSASEPVEMVDDGSTPEGPLRPSEKRRLNFEGKLYLAPLTTVGNLPFRRLCGRFGSDIHCGEMGLATEFLTGNTQEWSLVRRHPEEKIFGVQICGSRPQVLVPTAEAIVKACPDLDFLDVNLGCPIGECLSVFLDTRHYGILMVVPCRSRLQKGPSSNAPFEKQTNEHHVQGGGSALLEHVGKLGKSLTGMSRVLGEIPLTIKMRTGVRENQNVAHKLVPKARREWGVGALTVSVSPMQRCMPVELLWLTCVVERSMVELGNKGIYLVYL